VSSVLRRQRGATQFERAADGSMSLMEHLRELRNRLFKSVLGVLVGFGFGVWLAPYLLDFLQRPYCDYVTSRGYQCGFVQLGVTDLFFLKLQIAIWAGIILAAPIWLYQLWAFIAPGLHRHERRWAYGFVTVASPLFVAGCALAYVVTGKALEFLVGVGGGEHINAAFEFPLIVVLLNLAGVASAKRLLSWWRVVVFLVFAFAAITTPTPDPFMMTGLGLIMSGMYFAAVGFAFLNDRRRARRLPDYGAVGDDEASPLDLDAGPVASGSLEDGLAPVAPPLPLDRRYDDST
jgi:sec-independent protein translocase protein TatC